MQPSVRRRGNSLANTPEDARWTPINIPLDVSRSTSLQRPRLATLALPAEMQETNVIILPSSPFSDLSNNVATVTGFAPSLPPRRSYDLASPALPQNDRRRTFVSPLSNVATHAAWVSRGEAGQQEEDMQDRHVLELPQQRQMHLTHSTRQHVHSDSDLTKCFVSSNATTEQGHHAAWHTAVHSSRSPSDDPSVRCRSLRDDTQRRVGDVDTCRARGGVGDGSGGTPVTSAVHAAQQSFTRSLATSSRERHGEAVYVRQRLSPWLLLRHAALAVCLLNATLALLFASWVGTRHTVLARVILQRRWQAERKARALRRAGMYYLLLALLLYVDVVLRYTRRVLRRCRCRPCAPLRRLLGRLLRGCLWLPRRLLRRTSLASVVRFARRHGKPATVMQEMRGRASPARSRCCDDANEEGSTLLVSAIGRSHARLLRAAH